MVYIEENSLYMIETRPKKRETQDKVVISIYYTKFSTFTIKI